MSLLISNHWKTTIKIVLGLGLLLGLIASVDFSHLVKSIYAANLNLLLFSFILFSMQGIFESWRLQVVFVDYGIRIRDGIQLFYIGLFFSNFMPGTLGADIYLINYMHNIRTGLKRPLSLSIFFRLTGLLVNIVIGVLAFYMGTLNWDGGINLQIKEIFPPDWWMPVLVFLMFILAGLVTTPVGQKYLRLFLGKVDEITQDFLRVVTSVSLDRLALISLLGIFVAIARAASIYVLVIAFGLSINFIDAIVVVTAATLIMSLPISLAGLGVREISVTVILIACGVPLVVAVAIAVVSRSFIWMLSLAGGLWFLFSQRQARINT